MKKEYDFSKMKELKNPYAGKKKAVGIKLETGSRGLLQGPGGRNWTSLPEVNRSLSPRLRKEAWVLGVSAPLGGRTSGLP
jgi:hypothetical protein